MRDIQREILDKITEAVADATRPYIDGSVHFTSVKSYGNVIQLGLIDNSKLKVAIEFTEE